MKDGVDYWIYNDWALTYDCPICQCSVDAERNKNYRFCPNCGTRLYPPREEVYKNPIELEYSAKCALDELQHVAYDDAQLGREK